MCVHSTYHEKSCLDLIEIREMDKSVHSREAFIIGNFKKAQKFWNKNQMGIGYME